MYDHLKGKKLLIIGSDEGNISIVDAAREMGIYTIAADGITDHGKAPAKLKADEAWDIDYSKTQELAEKCRQKGVDGVFAGYSEYRVLAACRIAKALGTPFYATEEQIQITRNKRTFKDLCQKYGIPVPRDYCFKELPNRQELDKIEYPVIVKPADYAGRKGITVCFEKEQLRPAVDYALSKSQSGTVIIEDYLRGVEFSSVYTLKDGVISLSAVNEKYVTDDQQVKTGLCDFVKSPPYFYEDYVKTTDGKVREFIKGIGAQNGVVFFQGMVCGGKIYIFEMGYRLNGNNDYVLIDRFNGINYMKMMIAYSLCGDMCDDISKDNPLYPEYTGVLVFNAHEGRISKIDYSSLEGNKNICDIELHAAEGKVIKEDGSTGQCVAKIKVSADSVKELAEIIRYIQANFTVRDERGKNMLFKPFDAGILLKKKEE